MIKQQIVIALMTVVSCCQACNAGTLEASDSIPTIPPVEFAQQTVADTTAVIIDVRTPEEYAAGHIDNATLIDVKNTENFDMTIALLPSDKTYYVYCRSGRRSMSAAEKMKKAGLNVIDMTGGIIAWEKADLPVVKNRK